MFKYQRYLIRPTDHFDPASYPFLEEKIPFLKVELDKIFSAHRTEMIISYFKEHYIKSEWEISNPGLVEMINSKALALSDFEELFESCKKNTVFTTELETYLIEQFDVVEVDSYRAEVVN